MPFLTGCENLVNLVSTVCKRFVNCRFTGGKNRRVEKPGSLQVLLSSLKPLEKPVNYCAIGIEKKKVLPWPSWLWAQIFPPCASTM